MIEHLVTEHCSRNQFELFTRWNTLQPPWSDQGWPLALPNVQWNNNTRLVLHFQDRITAAETGCAELKHIEQHYTDRANQVIVVFYSHGLDRIYQGPVQLVEFSTHNWLTVKDLLRVQSSWQSVIDQPKTQAWQCLNGRVCDHRERAAQVLASWPNGTLSLGTQISLPEWHYGTYRGTENYDNFVRLASLYGSTQVNIVTETDYVARPGVISEKTLYAFVAQQIPIIIGHPGAVQDCRDMGFDMLDDLVDHSYDWLPNDQRAEAALELNRELILGQVDVTAWQSRIDRNHHYVLGDFLQWMQNQAQADLAMVF